MAQGSPHLLRTLPSLLLLLALQQGDGHAHFCRLTTALGLPQAPGEEQVELGAAGPRQARVQLRKARGGGGSDRCPFPNPPSPRPGRPRLPVRVLVSPGGRSRRRSVWAIGVFGPLQLHLEPLHADLEAVHGLDGGLRAGRVVEAHEAWRDTRDEGLGFHGAAPAGRGGWGEGRGPRAGRGGAADGPSLRSRLT